jgi:SNF2 family DNA or RNA helicase
MSYLSLFEILQLSLSEYFKLLDWCRPGVLGTFENFDRNFIQQIMAGLSSDSTPQQVADQVRTSKLLFNTMSPYMQRRGICFLKRDLPPSQTVVLYIRQSKLQSRLYRSFETYFKSLQSHEKLSFISHYQMLRPLHNHPYCLLQQSMSKSCERKGNLNSFHSVTTIEAPKLGNESPIAKVHANKSLQGIQTSHDDPNFITYDKPHGRKHYQWMESVISKMDKSSISSVKHGHKIFLLLQILAISESLGDKVLVFTQCLKTLDLIETVLTSSNWARYCCGQEKNKSLSNWKKGTDYVRIDGSVHASERGVLISNFNEELGGVKAFLLSIEAGGMG